MFVSTSAAEYFHVSLDAINWLSIASCLAFLPAAPFAMWALNTSGPKLSMVIASILCLVGN